MARPEKPIDWDMVDRLLEAQCNGKEIAAYFNVSPETFYERVVKKHEEGFSSYSHRFSSKGLALLKLAQFNKAVGKLNPTMLMWLGKQYLNQTESPDKGVNETTLDQFDSLMGLLQSLQSDRKIESININEEHKS